MQIHQPTPERPSGLLARLRWWAGRLLRRRGLPPGWVTLTDESGQVTGIADPIFAAYLESTGPNPSQASLDAALGPADRLRVMDWDEQPDGSMDRSKVLLETTDPAALDAVRSGLAINEDPNTFGHCMCLGCEALELYAGAERLATIVLHHGILIRWDAWKHDAMLLDGAPLRRWLADHGVPGPQREVDEAEERQRAFEERAARWRRSVPACLAVYADALIAADAPTSGPLAEVSAALEAAYPSLSERALVLLAWYGAVPVPWNPCYVYELVPECLLSELPTEELVAALQDRELTEAEAEGAARYFAGWQFTTKKRRDRTKLPAELRARLLAHVLQSPHADNQARARKAFE